MRRLEDLLPATLEAIRAQSPGNLELEAGAPDRKTCRGCGAFIPVAFDW